MQRKRARAHEKLFWCGGMDSGKSHPGTRDEARQLIHCRGEKKKNNSNSFKMSGNTRGTQTCGGKVRNEERLSRGSSAMGKCYVQKCDQGATTVYRVNKKG